MKTKMSMLLVALCLTTALGTVLSAAVPAQAACTDGEKIDGSTAGQARKKFEAAGYRQVKELHKGCDNYWHTVAVKDGKPVRAVLSPQGEIVQEGD